jgi:LPXTG-motif cell wall-anchored protein
MRKVVAIVALVGLLALSGAALAQTPAEQQYGSEPPAAGTTDPAGTTTESTQVKPGVFEPPAAEASDDGGLLPFTGAQLILPAVLGATMLGVGLFVVYRTRRRGN